MAEDQRWPTLAPKSTLCRCALTLSLHNVDLDILGSTRK
ncbi:hypothetical protein I542_2319 [Mycobacteroides abscessus 1948]|uniref:Uncharacterized protein n=2 Tax=Mycobacteroides abscessus TaxID=36809 RepID=A0A829QG45_9MYCO|nr:hypothetical protein I543_3809 [Mycobacteroides abscessus 21]EUA62172.1 hypothetical protein I542_2319 [Mycobacteroides abscessus 1948]